jgi:hypothetical protein
MRVTPASQRRDFDSRSGFKSVPCGNVYSTPAPPALPPRRTLFNLTRSAEPRERCLPCDDFTDHDDPALQGRSVEVPGGFESGRTQETTTSALEFTGLPGRATDRALAIVARRWYRFLRNIKCSTVSPLSFSLASKRTLPRLPNSLPVSSRKPLKA